MSEGLVGMSQAWALALELSDGDADQAIRLLKAAIEMLRGRK